MANELRFRASIKDDVSGPLDKMRDRFERVRQQGVKPLFQGVAMGAGIAAFDAVKGAAIGAGAAVLDFGKDSVQAASDQREAMSLNSQVFEDHARAVETWADGAADAFGQSKREALTFASEFGNAFKNVGFALDDTAERAKTMTHLAADLGSAFNKSSEEAALALRSGLLGESEPLRKFGVFLNETKVKAKATAMGLKPLHGELSDGQKVAARYALIMEQTADSQGMFGRDSESLADATKTLNAELENLKAKLGTQLTPALVDVTTATTDLVDAAGHLPDPWSILDAITLDIFNLDKQTKTWADNTSEAAAQAAESWATGSERIAMAAGRGTTRIEELAEENADAADEFKKVRDRAAKAAKALDDYAESVGKAMDAVAEAAFGPEQLALSLEADKLALQDAQTELKKLERIKSPTKDQRADIVDTKLRISELEESIFGSRKELMLLDGLSTSDLRKQIDFLSRRGLYSKEVAERMRQAWRLALQAEGYSGPPRPNQPGGGHIPHAAGGPVLPGQSYLVGENGPELLYMGHGPGSSGFMQPNVPRPSGGSGGAPAVIQLVVDRRVLAEVVYDDITAMQQRNRAFAPR